MTFFACGSSVPGRVEHEGGTAAWLAGTLAAPVVQGHKLPVPQELWPYLLGFFFVCFFCLFVLVFLNLLNLVIRTLWPVFLCGCPIQALIGLPCLRSFSVILHGHIEGPPRMGSYSVDQCIRHLKGHPE